MGATCPTHPLPARSCHRGCLRWDFGTKVQGFPIWLCEDGKACPSPGIALQRVVQRSLGSRTGVWALGSKACVLGGFSRKGKHVKGTLSGIPGWWARQASRPRDSTGEAEGSGQQEEA